MKTAIVASAAAGALLGHRALRQAPRAETPGLAEVRAALTAVQQNFADFQAANNRRLDEIAAGRSDVVTTEQVDRINAAVSEAQGAVDDLNRRVAALQLGGGGAEPLTPEAAAYNQAFNNWFRRGVEPEAGMQALAVQASLSRGSDPDGGYVAPSEVDSAITRVLGTVSAMRSLATVRTIGGASYKKPINKGGANSGWTGETDSRSETDTPRLSVLDFPAMELYANPAATQTLLDDAQVDIAAWLAEEVAVEFAEQEGEAFISGNGVAKPRGILSYDTVANASYEWGKLGFIVSGGAADFASTTPDNALIDLTMAIKSGYRAGASWMMNRATAAKIRKFKDTTGQPLWQPSMQLGQPAALLGYPVADDDNMPDVGAGAFPIAFGNFARGYVIVDRVGVRVLRDPFTNKPYVHFYTTKRVGGGVQMFEAIKLLKIAAS